MQLGHILDMLEEPDLNQSAREEIIRTIWQSVRIQFC